ncbi:MAG: CDP-diacylglycerol--glycerol-3-phosphate 3-phosphatidyltransferase [Clostridia bacterium]|nr:CDP-diacylglycerol--glycerol-3-phosphate 3-phosphatidyltransferase [Clostridia bacterium]
MFVLNIPNVLTIIRIILIPIFIALFCHGQTAPAFAVYAAACVTDAADGYLARRLNQVTAFGKLMDPLADKLMQLSMMLCLAVTGYLPWWVVIVLLAKETVMVTGGTLLFKKRDTVVMSNWSGKVATALLMLAIAAIFPWHGVEAVSRIGHALLYAGLGMSLFSMVYYGLIYVKNGKGGKVKNGKGGKAH